MGKEISIYKFNLKCQLLTLLFICFCASIVQSQTKFIDSLDRLIKAENNDTARIKLINSKIYKLNQINLDSGLELARKNLANAQRINFTNGEAQSLLYMATNYSMRGDYPAAKHRLLRADSLLGRLQNSDLKGSLYSGFGMLYGIQSKYDSSAVYYKKAIDIYEKSDNKIGLGRSYGNLAISYQMQSNFPQALFYQQKSLKLSEDSNNKTSQAYVLMNMGNTYEKLGDTIRSEQSFLKGMEIARALGIRNVELYGYSNIASLYYKQKKWGKSYTYAIKATDLAKSMGDESIRAASMAKAALALMQNREYGNAEELATEAIKIADSAAQPLTIYQVYSTKGRILSEQGKYKTAIPFLLKSITTIKKVDGYEDTIAETYAALSLCYEKIGRYNLALQNFKVSAQITDSIRADENIRKATELSMTYDFEKKQAIAQAEQAKKDADAKRIKNRQLFVIAALGIIGLSILTIALILYKNNKRKQLANARLKRQKYKVEATLTELKATQAQLIQAEKMASLGELTAGIAHEIQNPLNFVNNFSELSNELMDEMNEEIEKRNLKEANTIAKDIKQNLDKIHHHGKRADAIVKGMLLHSRSNSGEKELTDINALCDEYLRLAYHGLRAKDKSFNAVLKTDLDPTIQQIKVTPQDMGRVLLNLITNAFYAVNTRFQQEKDKTGTANPVDSKTYRPAVSISTEKRKNNIVIKIEDNGTGISKEILGKIFQPFFTTKPTGQGTGLGLSLSYDIVKAHGGKLEVKSREDKGTTFTIRLPIN